VCETDDKLVQQYKQSNRPILIITLLSPQGKSCTVKALLDTGATKDYISLEVATWLKANGSIEKSNNKKFIGSGFKNICSSCTASIDIEANLHGSELVRTNELVKLRCTALVIDASIDLVIGLATLRSNDLILHYPSTFLSKRGQHLLNMLKTYEAT
jgi:hypothetical protein